MGVTLIVKAHGVVDVVEVRDVGEGHGGREVFVVGKSGLFGLFSLPRSHVFDFVFLSKAAFIYDV